jgi:hypothetical protein
MMTRRKADLAGEQQKAAVAPRFFLDGYRVNSAALINFWNIGDAPSRKGILFSFFFFWKEWEI